MRVTTTAFTAVQAFPGSKPMILPWATASTAGAVRKEVGDAWDIDHEGHAAGWLKARKACIRVIKVEITALKTRNP